MSDTEHEKRLLQLDIATLMQAIMNKRNELPSRSAAETLSMLKNALKSARQKLAQLTEHK